MILLVHIRDVVSGTTRTLEFTRSPVRIGRNQLNDIPLEDPFVSEWHGSIRFDAGGAAYFDMGSTNGTLLDGKRVPKNLAMPLSAQSRLLLGRREVTVAPPPPLPAPAPDDGFRNKTIGLGQPLPAGRIPSSDGSMRIPSGRGFPPVRAPSSGGGGAAPIVGQAPPPAAPPSPALEKLLEAFT
jgi:FHA domain